MGVEGGDADGVLLLLSLLLLLLFFFHLFELPSSFGSPFTKE